ncbi:MAG: hypothetical protein IK116_05505, partial [Firmicutes bacterium]|nr:hypothetical protein [Bacillota bacterium]
MFEKLRSPSPSAKGRRITALFLQKACFARILTSRAARGLPYLCTPTTARCLSSGLFGSLTA